MRTDRHAAGQPNPPGSGSIRPDSPPPVRKPALSRGTRFLSRPEDTRRLGTGDSLAFNSYPPAGSGTSLRGTTDAVKAVAAARAAGGAPGAIPAADRPRVERSPADSTRIRPARDGAIDRADEQMNLDALPPEKRAMYERLARRVEGNPGAREALYNLLSIGTVSSPTLRGGEDLLSVLDRMTTQPLAAGIDRDALLQQTLIEIDDGSTIGQKDKNSCGATAVQVTLANRQPAEYARLVSGLASPEGRIGMANGDTLSREADWNAADGGRSIPSRLLQPALMEYANGGLTNYDNGTDRSRRLDGSTYTGLYTDEAQRLYQGVLNAPATVEDTNLNTGAATPAATMQNIADAIGRGQNVAALIDYPGTGGHYVTVTGVRGDRVMYQNPWGTVESMPRAAFQARLLGAVYPGAGTPASPAPQPAPQPQPPQPAQPPSGPPPPSQAKPAPAPAPQQGWLSRLWAWVTK